jgi:hypothetical protein
MPPFQGWILRVASRTGCFVGVLGESGKNFIEIGKKA